MKTILKEIARQLKIANKLKSVGIHNKIEEDHSDSFTGLRYLEVLREITDTIDGETDGI